MRSVRQCVDLMLFSVMNQWMTNPFYFPPMDPRSHFVSLRPGVPPYSTATSCQVLLFQCCHSPNPVRQTRMISNDKRETQLWAGSLCRAYDDNMILTNWHTRT